MNRLLKVPQFDWAWILVLSLWRFVIATRHGLGVDEAHYALYGMRLDWSYFDHPPLVGWVQWAFITCLGKSEWAVRVPAILSGIATSILTFRLCQDLFHDTRLARWGTLALNFCFLPSALWLMFLPDTLLLVFVLWLIFITFRLRESPTLLTWVQLGVCLGLCGLTKYTAIFLVISLLGIFWSQNLWKKINWIYFSLAVLIAIVLVFPVFYWNMKNHWASFAYQQNHVMGGQKLNFAKFLTFLATQLLAFSPFIIFPAFWGWGKFCKIVEPKFKVILWYAIPTFLFFIYTSFKDEVLPHWTLISWCTFLPVGSVLALESRPKWRWSIMISGLLLIFVMTELTFQFLKFPPYQSPYADLTGWTNLRGDLKKIFFKEKPNTFGIGVTNWTQGSRANFYLSYLGPVFVLDDRFDQFDFWEKSQPHPENLLILQFKGFDLHQDQRQRCSKIEPVTHKIFLSHGSPINAVNLMWCRGYRW